MDVGVFAPAVVGAVFGACGWLMVGLYMQRRQYQALARNAGRAVYFELMQNRLIVEVALEYGSFSGLSRSSFDRLLPELTTWMSVHELKTVVEAYMGHIGYEDARSNGEMPSEIRRQALAGILSAQADALEMLGRRVFSRSELEGIAVGPTMGNVPESERESAEVMHGG